MFDSNSILFLYYKETHRNDAQNVEDFILSFSEFSKYQIIYKNVFEGFDEDIGRIDSKIIILHYSMFGTQNYTLSSKYLSFLENTNNHKIAIFQDEGWYFKTRLEFVDKYKIDSILTCFEPSEFNKTYYKYTNVKNLLSVIPGYVSEELLEKAKEFEKSYEDRAFDITYRSRELPYFVGDAGREKVEIGHFFNEKLLNSDLDLDICTDNSDRLYGDDWYRFLGESKAVLGIESGYSIVDIDNSVSKKYYDLIAQNSKLTYKEFCEKASVEIEKNSNVFYRTISPRHFEAAAFKCIQILFEGKYSDILEPWVHYIPIKKDFSNFEDVLKSLKNKELVDRIINRAYEDLILSKNYTYEKFIQSFDDFIQTLNINISYGTCNEFKSISKDVASYNKKCHKQKEYKTIDEYITKIKNKKLLLIANTNIDNEIEYIKNAKKNGIVIGCLNNVSDILVTQNIIPDFIFINISDIRPALSKNEIKKLKEIESSTTLLFSDDTNAEVVEKLDKLNSFIIPDKYFSEIEKRLNIPSSFISFFINQDLEIKKVLVDESLVHNSLIGKI